MPLFTSSRFSEKTNNADQQHEWKKDGVSIFTRIQKPEQEGAQVNDQAYNPCFKPDAQVLVVCI